MSPLHPVAPRKSEDSITVITSPDLSYYPITESDIQVIAVLWALFLVTSVFVGLRLYSRVKILQFYALEDYLYNVAFVSTFVHFSLFLGGLFFFVSNGSSCPGIQFPSMLLLPERLCRSWTMLAMSPQSLVPSRTGRK